MAWTLRSSPLRPAALPSAPKARAGKQAHQLVVSVVKQSWHMQILSPVYTSSAIRTDHIPVSAFTFAPSFTLALNNYYSAFQVPSVLLISKCLQVYWKQIF